MKNKIFYFKILKKPRSGRLMGCKINVFHILIAKSNDMCRCVFPICLSKECTNRDSLEHEENLGMTLNFCNHFEITEGPPDFKPQ